VPPVSLERTLQVSIGEDRKSRSSDCFSVLASLSIYKCDLTFAYDVISILHVLFVFNNKIKIKNKKFWENLQDFFSSWLIRYCMYFYLISQFCEH
jgi:hypothetical protein